MVCPTTGPALPYNLGELADHGLCGVGIACRGVTGAVNDLSSDGSCIALQRRGAANGGSDGGYSVRGGI